MRKFLQLIHSSSTGGDGSHGDEDAMTMKKKRSLPLDLQLECDEFVFQICDDPFEIKLRANYVVRT